jgi:hypothetical protein
MKRYRIHDTSRRDAEGDEARLRVYDKLWENIIHKENRLWTFLTVYGAAVGFIVSQDLTRLGSFHYPAYIALLLLTYWAAEIIIDSDWWSVRNRLMIGGIERHHRPSLQGVIPNFYNSIGYRGESLHTASMVVVVAVGLMSYLVAMNEIFKAPRGTATAWWATALLFGAGSASVRCLHVRERRLREYYLTLRDLAAQQRHLDEDEIANQEKKDLKRLGQRWKVFWIYGFLVGVLGWHAWENLEIQVRPVLIALQVGIFVIYLLQYCEYVSGRSDPIGFRLLVPTIQKKDDRARIEMYAWRNRFMFLFFVLYGAIIGLSIAKPQWWKNLLKLMTDG